MTEIRNFFAREWTERKKTLLIACCILLGTVNGFLISRSRRGSASATITGTHTEHPGENTEPPAGRDRKNLPKQNKRGCRKIIIKIDDGAALPLVMIKNPVSSL